MLVEPTTVSSEDWRQPSPSVQEELKEFQTILLNLLQNTAEISLLETKADRLRTIKSLDENLNEFYYLLLGTVRTQKAQVKHFIWLDEMVASAAKEQTDNKLEETLKGIRAESHEAYVKRHSDSQDLAKRITELMEKIDIEIREFFHSLEGKV
jgi:predicted  nucleic acid-binding Zn-ribbon protein